ncbi:hypothetical protein K0M31_020326 [Melipona bicolor]|uniref:Uncharacterized protein n=1 Tax=Melipona bicolor TaxID=60889 RepID=A0AA40G1I6_9HYME|nr:hypothetical protein K0M31_020326 [Melipona bicolor]
MPSAGVSAQNSRGVIFFVQQLASRNDRLRGERWSQSTEEARLRESPARHRGEEPSGWWWPEEKLAQPGRVCRYRRSQRPGIDLCVMLRSSQCRRGEGPPPSTDHHHHHSSVSTVTTVMWHHRREVLRVSVKPCEGHSRLRLDQQPGEVKHVVESNINVARNQQRTTCATG